MKKMYLLRIRCVEYYFCLAVSAFWIAVSWFIMLDGIIGRVFSLGFKLGCIELVVCLGITFVVPVILMGLHWFGYSKELFYTIIDENGYQSCRFWRKYCYVDKGKDIYYVLYHYPYYRMDFIAF